MGLYEEWLDLRSRIGELKTRKDEVQAKLIAEMGGKPAEVTYGADALKLTPVTGFKTSWDGPRVLERLSVPQRRRMAVVELDVEAFTAALTSKELPAAKFEPFKTVEPIKPYIRVSKKA